MDFKSLMSAQIAKAKPPANGTSNTTTSKYQRRADLEAERQRSYAAEQARVEAEREERSAKKRKLEEEDAEKVAQRDAKLKRLAEESKVRREGKEREEERQRRKRLGLPELPAVTTSDGESTSQDRPDIPDDELKTLLREIDQPATFYDESHSARLTRYYGFIQPAKQLSNTPIPTTLPLLEEKDMLLPATLPLPNTTEQKHLYSQIASYFTLLLTNWSHDLSARDSDTADSTSGRAATNNYNTVLTDLTPLFRHLENNTLPTSLLSPLCDIIRHAQNRRYVSANDAYLTLSIGKAAWPIGVTMVGIHERSAREKLHDGEAGGHILGDEGMRKMVQGVKRCLSYAQVRWPPEDAGQLMG
jgi:pre-mRNA-splicing factor 18